MFGSLGKYRAIVITVALFLVFDLGVLVLNFVISDEIAQDAVNVNLAGRQRMLSQRTAKVALQLEDRVAAQQATDAALKELQLSFGLFDKTLTAFRSGGWATGGGGKALYLEALSDEKSQAILDSAIVLWNPYRDSIQRLITSGAQDPELIARLARTAEANNLPLLALMNDLTTRVEELASAKATTLRAVQVGGITLATINFVLILFHFIRQLGASDRRLERAKRETDDILETTQEGLFLLAPDFSMGTQQSKALAHIFGRQSLGGENLLELLRPLVTERTLVTAREYIALLLGDEVNEKLVVSLNPLDRVEVSLARGPGELETRYLQFRFNRVTGASDERHLLVTVNDITKRVRLEQDLKHTEERAQGQMGLLVEILQAEPSALRQFLRGANEGLEEINQLLRGRGGDAANYDEKVNGIFRVAHRLKGDASALGMHKLSQSIHSLEDLLATLRSKDVINGEDFLPVTVRVRQLFADLETVQDAVSRISQIRGVVTVEPPRPPVGKMTPTPFVATWQAFADRIAARGHNHAEVAYSGIDVETLPTAQRDAVHSIVTQFIRNAVAHGIEEPQDRLRAGKASAGRLAIYVSRREDGCVDLSFRDDGRGISIENVRDAAVRNGRVDARQAGGLDARTVIALIFEPGFSTRPEVDEDAGRGTGLDTVKDLVSRLGGHIRVGSTTGEYCHFRVSLPAPRREPDLYEMATANGLAA